MDHVYDPPPPLCVIMKTFPHLVMKWNQFIFSTSLEILEHPLIKSHFLRGFMKPNAVVGTLFRGRLSRSEKRRPTVYPCISLKQTRKIIGGGQWLVIDWLNNIWHGITFRFVKSHKYTVDTLECFPPVIKFCDNYELWLEVSI